MRLRLKEHPDVEVTFAGRTDVGDFLAENPDWEEVPKAPATVASDPLIEALAALEHEQWAQWAQTLMRTESGISTERQARWARLASASYSDLSEAEKDQDRVWAERVMQIVREHA